MGCGDKAFIVFSFSEKEFCELCVDLVVFVIKKTFVALTRLSVLKSLPGGYLNTLTANDDRRGALPSIGEEPIFSLIKPLSLWPRPPAAPG